MTNPYYNGGAFPATGAPATSASMRAELASISTGFDKLPTLSGNANKLVTVNSSGTALEAVSVLPSLTITDTNLVVEDNADSTRKFRFEASGITAGATRVLTIPDASTTLVGTDAVQTLTNKTINLTSNLFTATSAQLAAAVTDETGTGSLVFGTNPTISDATLGGTVTLSAGTANGVTYLNGSKVLTSGSALTFDGGILTAPQLRTTNTAGAIFNTSTGAYAQWQYNAAAVGDIGTANQVVGSGATTDFAITSRGASGNLVFGINTSEQMRLTSTGLGIGTSSPGAKLEVNVPGTTGTSSALRLSRGIGYGTTDFKQYYTSGTDYGLTIGNTVSDYLTLNLASGNLGLGVTPSAWSGVTALQVSGTAALYATNTVTGLSFNQYFNGTNNIYLQNNYSNRLQMDSGAFKFFTAPSGTAGNAISFTQAMTLDASGNLGVGTTSPGAKLDVSSTSVIANFTHTTTNQWAVKVISSGSTELQMSGAITGNSGPSIRSVTSGGAAYAPLTLDGSTVTLKYGGTTGVLLDSSGNLGLGVTPSAWQSAYKALEVGNSLGIIGGSNAADLLYNAFINSSGNLIYRATDTATYYSLAQGKHRWGVAPSGTAGNAITFTTAMTLDASGNLGLGVTPSAWGSTFRALQIARSSLFTPASGGSTYLDTNAYFDSVGYKYIANGFATEYAQVTDGSHRWYTAPSGTAGNAISFTQAMTLDASGNLAVGTSTTTNAKIFSFVNDATLPGLGVRQDGAGPIQIWQGSGGNERARITSGGDLLVGTTSTGFTGRVVALQPTSASNVLTAWNSATTGDNSLIGFFTEAGGTGRGSITYNRAGGLVAYNTTSDYRAKDILGPVANPGATIDALKVYEGQMKGATQSRPMLVAHEAQAVAPYSVTGEKDAVNEDGTPKFQQMDVSSLVPLLLAEIQSLRARVAALESN